MFFRIKNHLHNISRLIIDINRESVSIDPLKFQIYQNKLIHRWMHLLYIVGLVTHLGFSFLDYIVIPSDIFANFILYRLTTIVIILITFLIIYNSKPTRFSFLYGYFMSLVTGIMIGQMTVDLGGFDSSYYAGMNILIAGVNLFLPWKYYHSALNGILVILIYVVMNFITPNNYQMSNLINNIYFVSSIVLATTIIGYFHWALIQSEYSLRMNLHRVKDKLWDEMELAKRIQISLLPDMTRFRDYEIASLMLPSNEVGGDYFDLIEDLDGNGWVAMGDVSGHGVESGLVMMMAHTMITSVIRTSFIKSPTSILLNINKILMNNISRLGMDRYMTLVLMHLTNDKIVFSGRHMDFLVYRKASNDVEVISEKGAFMAIYEDISDDLQDHTFSTNSGDVILLYTDGLTEASDSSGRLYGQERLIQIFRHNGDKSPGDILQVVIEDVFQFQKEQRDDVTLLVMKRA